METLESFIYSTHSYETYSVIETHNRDSIYSSILYSHRSCLSRIEDMALAPEGYLLLPLRVPSTKSFHPGVAFTEPPESAGIHKNMEI